jgi:hypothetical protein
MDRDDRAVAVAHGDDAAPVWIRLDRATVDVLLPLILPVVGADPALIRGIESRPLSLNIRLSKNRLGRL